MRQYRDLDTTLMKVRALLVLLVGQVALTQSPAGLSTGAQVSGFVIDSITRQRMSSAAVQLVSSDDHTRFSRTVTSDSIGHFVFDGVPDGPYMLGFFHPLLDSLGIEPPLRRVAVAGGKSMRVDIGVPSAARLRDAICATQAHADSGGRYGVIVGVVRDARLRIALDNTLISAEWLEVTLGKTGTFSTSVRRTTTTRANGWFAMCGVPHPATVMLTASRGTDSTDVIELAIPDQGYLRRELLLGSRQPADGILKGTVQASDGGRALAGARVGIPGGPQTRANENGEFLISNAPLGTRTMEVRAVGFYPERRTVDITTDMGALQFALSTFSAKLDTIRVLANQTRQRDIARFQERRRSGIGQYLTAEDVARKNPLSSSELFRSLSGVRMLRDASGNENRVFLRGNMDGWCTPAIFLNGSRVSGADGYAIPGITADDLDAWVNPREIAGIEIYAGPGAPAEYTQGVRESRPGQAPDSNCGSILIWTK